LNLRVTIARPMNVEAKGFILQLPDAQPRRLDYDNYSVQLFPEEAPTPAKRLAVSTFVQNYLYQPVWVETLGEADPEHRVVRYVTAEWVKETYESYLREGLSWRPFARAGHPLDPRFALEHVIGEALRQIEKTQGLKTPYDPQTFLGQQNIVSLDHRERIYNTMLGLAEQASRLKVSSGQHPSLPGAVPLKKY
jgi:hypothetical protein